MSGTKISALPSASSLDGTELVAGVQSAATVHMTAQAIADLAHFDINAEDYGASPDGRYVTDIVTTATSTTATSATANFTSLDVGKTIKYYRFSDDAYGDLTTILAVNSATNITLGHAAPITISSGAGYAFFGTDQSPFIQAALDQAQALGDAAFVSFNFPAGSGQYKVVLPADAQGGGYLLGAQLTIYRNTILDAPGMLFNALSNGATDREVPLYFKPGASCDRLRLHAGWGSGAIFGDANVNAHSFLNDVAIWAAGTNFDGGASPQNQIAADFYGYDWSVNRLWLKGQGATAGGICLRAQNTSDCMFSRLFCIGTAIGIQLDGCEQMMFGQVNLDSLRYVGVNIENSNNVTFEDCQAFNNYDAFWPSSPYEMTYGLLIGEFNPGADSRSLRIRYAGSVTGGQLCKISHCENANLELFGSNASQFTNVHGSSPITLGIEYGSGLSGVIAVAAHLDDGITVTSGDFFGTLSVQQAGVQTFHSPTEVAPELNYVGAELLSNPTFLANDTGWTYCADCTTWSSGAFVSTYDTACDTGCADPSLKADFASVAGSTYHVRVTFTISGDQNSIDFTNNSSGSVAPSAVSPQDLVFVADYTGTDTLTLDLDNYNTDATRTITSVSVREIVVADAFTVNGLGGTPILRIDPVYGHVVLDTGGSAFSNDQPYGGVIRGTNTEVASGEQGGGIIIQGGIGEGSSVAGGAVNIRSGYAIGESVLRSASISVGAASTSVAATVGMQGGDNSSGASIYGGQAFVVGGTGSSVGYPAGQVVVRGGDNYTADDGGQVNLDGGPSYGGGVGGAVYITGGTTTSNVGGRVLIAGGYSTSGDGSGGQLSLIGGYASGSGTPGSLTLAGASAAGSGGAGGLYIDGGSGQGEAVVGGLVRILGGYAGSSGDHAGGLVTVQGGYGVGTGDGGAVNITGGVASGSGARGTITFDGPIAFTGNTTINLTTTAPGILTMKSGDAGGAGINSGNVYLTTGNTGGNNATCGDLIVTLGAKSGGGTGRRGHLFMTNLPTSDPGISGAIWNNSGTLKISP